MFPKILQKSLIILEKSWSTRYLLIHPDLFVLNLFIWNHSNHSIPKLRIPWSFWKENEFFFHFIDFIISYISNKSFKNVLSFWKTRSDVPKLRPDLLEGRLSRESDGNWVQLSWYSSIHETCELQSQTGDSCMHKGLWKSWQWFFFNLFYPENPWKSTEKS